MSEGHMCGAETHGARTDGEGWIVRREIRRAQAHVRGRGPRSADRRAEVGWAAGGADELGHTCGAETHGARTDGERWIVRREVRMSSGTHVGGRDPRSLDRRAEVGCAAGGADDLVHTCEAGTHWPGPTGRHKQNIERRLLRVAGAETSRHAQSRRLERVAGVHTGRHGHQKKNRTRRSPSMCKRQHALTML